jgi:hypothetical protein
LCRSYDPQQTSRLNVAIANGQLSDDAEVEWRDWFSRTWILKPERRWDAAALINISRLAV